MPKRLRFFALLGLLAAMTPGLILMVSCAQSGPEGEIGIGGIGTAPSVATSGSVTDAQAKGYLTESGFSWAFTDNNPTNLSGTGYDSIKYVLTFFTNGLVTMQGWGRLTGTATYQKDGPPMSLNWTLMSMKLTVSDPGSGASGSLSGLQFVISGGKATQFSGTDDQGTVEIYIKERTP